MAASTAQAEAQKQQAGDTEPAPRGRRREEKSALEKIAASPLTRTVAGVVTRGLMGALLGKPPRRRRSY
jgi:hypothetical protein